MKKKLIALGMAGALSVTGFLGGVLSEPTIAEAASGIVLHIPENLKMGKGEKIYGYADTPALLVSEVYSNKPDSGSAKVASVGLDYIKGNVTGTCKIRFENAYTGASPVDEDNNKVDHVNVTVKKAPTDVDFSKSTMDVKVGDTEKSPVVEFEDGEYSYKLTYKVTSGSDKISIKKSGRRLKVSGVKKGTAKIKVTTFNGKTDTLKVTVK